MTQLTEAQVRHIAKLARLTLSDAEVKKFASELTAILDYVEVLKEVDTSKVAPAAQVTGLQNSLREDALRKDGAQPDALLSCSGLKIADHQIVTPSAHG
jgi:aspartyl-tRNA(Asn)/glutamyl-tRNA(Gln) amidotransferase subunit C